MGGGNGSFLSAILSRYQNANGILLERQPAIEAAKAGRGGSLPRCDLVVGDFFENVPENADAHVLKRVLHDWSDEQAVQILKNCRSAMGDNARLLIIEGLLGGPNEMTSTDLLDLMLLVVTSGQERSEEQYAKLLEAADLRLESVISTATALFVMEAAPA